MEIKKADKDIVCYKRLVKIKGYQLITPYRDTPIPLLCLMGIRKFKAKGDIDRVNSKSPKFPDEIHGGMIHTYVSEESAGNNMIYAHEEVWKCVIPKGTEYLFGVDGNEEPGYCSKAIRFKKKICQSSAY